MIILRLKGLQLHVEAIDPDERVPHGGMLAGTYRTTPGQRAPKLIARQVLSDPADLVELQAAFASAAQLGGPVLRIMAAFGDPGLVAALCLETREPWQDVDSDPELVFLGYLQRFAADFVAGGADLTAEAIAFVRTVLGDAPLVEPIEKAIQHMGL